MTPRERYGVLAVAILGIVVGSTAALVSNGREPRLLTTAELASIAEQCDESLLTWREVEAGLGCAEERIFELPRVCRCVDAEAYPVDSPRRELPRCPEVAEWEGGSDD